jgi:hypothetical protein
MSAAVRKALWQKARKAKGEDPGPVINEEAIIAVLSRAAEDKAFAAKPSEPDSEILDEYDLSVDEKAALVSNDLGWLKKHVSSLNDKIKVWLEYRLQQEKW